MATNENKTSVGEKVIYPELSYIIAGILFAVHNELGQYAKEKQYGDAIEKRFKEIKAATRIKVSYKKLTSNKIGMGEGVLI